MDLSTTYLGFRLPHPFVAGPSPLTDSLDHIRALEDAGAAAVVLPTLFEEEIRSEQLALHSVMDTPAESFGEALSYFAELEHSLASADEYMERLRAVKESVQMPVMASLNAVATQGWADLARLIEQAGADALELDFYLVAIDATESGETIEQRWVEALTEVRRAVSIPVSVKLTPFYTSLAHFSGRLVGAGADGLVLLHRFYEPDLDVENLEARSRLELSDSRELLLRLRWLAIVSGTVKCSLAVTGGVHSVDDAVKAIMTGAHAVQMVSALLAKGPDHLRTMRLGLDRWLEEHEYESLKQMCGSMNLQHIPEPKVLSRAHYMYLLRSWEARHAARR
ncbi:MAG: dihydroorotate dehydrogenase-like protein [Chloroflexota bacterium]